MIRMTWFTEGEHRVAYHSKVFHSRLFAFIYKQRLKKKANVFGIRKEEV